LLPAQQTTVVPRGMADIEGSLVLTYPFGRADGAIQVLADADQVTLGQGLLTGIAFRQSQVTATQTYAAYSKNYRVTVYTVATTAATMVADLAVNVGSATGTVVFQGQLNVPAVAPTVLQPAPFALQIPFSPPYVFDGSQGNLLLLVETADTAAVPSGSYRLDAEVFRTANIEGLVAAIDPAGCVVQGSSLTLAATASTAIVGGGLTTNLTASSAAFPAALLGLSLVRQDTDLSVFGMTGCTSYIGGFAFQVVLGGPAYPTVTWNVPPRPALEGLPLFTQALGIAASGQLPDSAVSNALAIRIGSATNPTPHASSAFRAGGNWSKGAAGDYLPIVQLQGVFP
jgi:hypothetical protein